MDHPLITSLSRQTKSFLLMLLCTVFGATAQILIKTGANGAPSDPVQILVSMLTNPYLFIGYSCYAVSTVLMTLALRHAELSMLYPVLALTFVWVAILSVVVFQEQMGPLRLAGIFLVVAGVAVLGRGSKK